MKAKVRLSYAVELFVEGSSEEAIMDWLQQTTPTEAKNYAKASGNMVDEDYYEEIICKVDEKSKVDYVI